MTNEKDIWPIKELTSWDEFEDQFSSKLYRNWFFRGHSKIDWSLESSLYRLFKDMKEIIKASKKRNQRFAKDDHEQELIRDFKSQAHLFLNTLPKRNDALEWLSLMQHYGTPTRLLDVTFSPYVAAFFALETGSEDCCVYAIDHGHFTEIDKEHFGNTEYKENVFSDQRGSKSFFFPFEPEMKNERIVAQQGAFLVSSTNYDTYDEIINNYEFDENSCVKYILKKEMRLEGLLKLRLMNITSATLFPGIDGFAQSLRFKVLDSIKRRKRLC